jgi:phage tail-like protein
MAHSRRTFLKSAGIATAAVSAAPFALALPGGPGAGPSTAAAAPGPRGFAAGHFALELDGQAVGILAAFQGGNAVADVIEFRDGTDPTFATKMPGTVHYEEITVVVGLAMDDAFWDWLGHMMDGDAQKKDGAIIMADFNYNAIRRLNFSDALVSEIGFPALDASSKDTAYLTVKIQPESTEWAPGSGKLVQPAAKQKTWLVSNFKFAVGDLPSNRVNKIEAFTIKQQIKEFREGDDRIPTKVPGRIEYPNLVFYLPALDLPPWQDFFDDFIFQGNNSPEDELEGSIEYLAPDFKAILGTVQFHHLGIFRLAPEEVDPNGTSLQRFQADMYSEGTRLFVGNLN